MASPTIDGSAINTGIASGVTSGTVTLTTTNANDIIVVIVALENTTAQGSTNKVTSVSKTSGTGTVGTFQKRGGVDGSSANSTAFIACEIWWAVATTALTSAVFTVNYNIAVDDSVLVACGVSGVGSTSSPWDPNAGLTAHNVNTTATATALSVASVSTTNADDLLIWASVNVNNTTITAPTPATFTSLQAGNNSPGTLEVRLDTFTKSVSATQSSVTFSSVSTAPGWIVLVDALTADTTASNPTKQLDWPNAIIPTRSAALSWTYSQQLINNQILMPQALL